MAQVFAAWSSDYKTLRISGTGYPQGTYRLTFDSSVDPTEGGVIDWHGYFSGHAGTCQRVIIEDEIYLDYANSMFENFTNCTSIQGISNIHGNLLNTTRMFANTPKLTQPITLENMISINCLDATEMFANSGFKEIILNNINMKNCTSMKGMFQNAKAETIEMTAIDTNSVRYADNMFAGCSNLQTIYGTGGYFDFTQAITSTNMFNGASLLTNWPDKGLDKAGAISVDDGGYINMSPYSVEFVDIRIREKYDTKDNWLYYDPVLFAGEIAIESDTNRFKVGDGAHPYSELPYMYGFKIDNITIKEDSETTELYVPIDEDTIVVGADGKIHAVEKLHGDQITIIQDSEGKLFLELDNRTIHVNDAGQLESIVEIDNKTIKEGINGLYVPIDNNTIFVDTDGKIKSKGDLTPGTGLEWDSTTPNKLNVRLGRTLDFAETGVDPGINVNFDGQTIYWDETTGPNGALRAMEVKSADGMVTVTPSAGHYYDLTLPIDDDTIKFENGVIKATAQVSEVDDVTIKLVDDKLTVPIDNDTIIVEGGKVKAINQSPEVDDVTIIINSEGKLEAVNQMPPIDEKTLQIKNDKLQVSIDNETIVYDSENAWIEVPNRLLQTENGIYAREDSEGTLYIGVYSDDKTLGVNNNGELGVKIDDETIVYDQENDWIEVNYQFVEFDDGLITEVDSETTHVKVLTDNKTIFINSAGELEGAPNVLVDGTTIIQDSEDVISVNIDHETIIYDPEDNWLEVPHKALQTENGIYAREDSETVYIGVYNDETLSTNSEGLLGVNIDHETIVYDKENDWIEVNYQFLEGENGIYLRNDSETTYIGVNVDGETILINSEGQLVGAPNVECDERTIIHNSEGKIEVHYDHETIIYGESEGLKVDGIEIVPISPVYIIENSEFNYYMIGCGYDNTTITLNERNELQTAVGGGWRCSPEEKIIATGTNTPKKRHHMLPDDDADYFLETVWFPNPLVEGNEIVATVTHDAAFMDPTVTLKYMKDWDIWYYDGRYWDSEGVAPEHPLNPHGYSIYVQKNKTVVQLHEDFETDPDTLTCTIKYGGKNCVKEYIDNQFVKVDNETIYVNNDGELSARLQLQQGKWIQISEGVISMGNLCQGLAYNEESNCIYVKDATDSEVGGVKIDNETLKINDNGQLAFDLDGMLDRGIDGTTGKIGHSNIFEGDLRQAGDPTSTVGIKWDDYGHLAEVERYDIPTLIGASSQNNGVRGFAPAPAAGDQKKFLRGDGTWSNLVDAGLFSVIETEGQWWVGTDRRTRVFSAEPNAHQIVIAPLGFTVDRDTEAIDVIYMTEMTLGHITITARSNTQAETLVKCKAYWLVLNV